MTEASPPEVPAYSAESAAARRESDLVTSSESPALYQRIAEHALDATDARIVALAERDPKTGDRQLLAFAAFGEAWRRALYAARELIPRFDPHRHTYSGAPSPALAEAFRTGKPVLAPFHEISTNSLPRAVFDVIGRVIGARFVYTCPFSDGAADGASDGAAGYLTFVYAWEPDQRERRICGAFAGQAALTLATARLSAPARERERLRGALLVARTTAHEINNALSPISGFAELLTMHPKVASDPQLAAYAKLITDSAGSLASRVRRLQSIVRLEESKTPLGPELPVLDLDRSTRA